MKLAIVFVLVGVFSRNLDFAETSDPLLPSEITESVKNESSSLGTLSAIQSLILRNLGPVPQLSKPILSNFLQVLKNLNKVARELGDSAPEKERNYFTTSNRYVNFRLVTFDKDYFAPKYIPIEFSLVRARKDCMWSCANNQSCLAFNLYAAERFYVCEMLPDNLCVNRTRLAFAEWPGSTVWEKVSTGMQQSCLEARFSVGRAIPCELLRPGCSGNWPHCSSCFRTCRDPWKKLNNYSGEEFTLWPEGDGPFVLPVFALCWTDSTYLLRRELNLAEASVTQNYIMPFQDIYRFYRLKTYRFIYFEFHSAFEPYFYQFVYKDWYIDASGTLTNMTLVRVGKDLFNVKGQALKPTPFVTVTDDRYGCGSFWLLDPNNATYCPGGQVSMLGTMKVEGGKVVSTGISLPEANAKNDTIYKVWIYLD